MGTQEFSPAALYNPDAREYLVVWQRHLLDSSTWQIFAQRLSGTGSLIGGNLAVTGGAGDKASPAIVYNRQAAEYMVVWQDLRNGTDNDIYGQRMAPNGALLGQAIPIAATWGHQTRPAVAWDAVRNAYLVIWLDRRNGAKYDLYGQRLAASGSLLGPNFPISTGAGSGVDLGTDLVWNTAEDEYLAVWDGVEGLYAQRITGTGGLRNQRFVAGGEYYPHLAYNAVAHEYLVTWGYWLEGAFAQRISGQPGFCSGVTEIPEGECEALVAFYQDMGGPGWTNRSGWLTTSTPCTWYGVTCASGHVTRLELNQNLLLGNLSSQLGNLRYLRRLSLYENQITGAIPAELANLADLQVITLASNQLTGTIPTWFGNLGNLTYFNLNGNQLSGSIPPALGNLTQLTTLELCANQLTGSIPSTLGNLVNLTQLNMYYNHLSGPIPPELGRLSRLIWLGLYNNELSGPIPGELANLTSLRGFSLQTNPLTGSFPSWLGNLGTLERIWLSDTQLTGPLPLNLTNLRLNRFWYDRTNLCEPADEGFQTWLGGISDLRGTARSCTRLSINHQSGGPGSYFILTGENFPPNATIGVSINNHPLGVAQVAGDGRLQFALSTEGADEGIYVVTTSATRLASVPFRLVAGGSVWPQDATTPLFAVPPGIALQVAAFLPFVSR